MYKYLLFFIFFLFICNCKNKEKRTITPAFHHWKGQLKLSDFEQQYCTELSAKTLYLRFFDVDFDPINKFPEPISELNFNTDNLINFDKIIPTIFITNRTLLHTNQDKIDSLGTLIYHKLAKHMEARHPAAGGTEGGLFQNKIQEILIDCDWTATTRDKYFQLIKHLKQLSDKKIITTIRLHQLRLSNKIGVPPADKGLLMAYNMGDLSDPQTINSILDVEVLKTYIAHLDNYPLVLDVALPLFSWGIVQRDGQAVQLIPNVSKDFLLKNKEKRATVKVAPTHNKVTPAHNVHDVGATFTVALPDTANTEGGNFDISADNKITILKNGYYNGMYLYADDVIKIEEVSLSDLLAAAELLSTHIQNKDLTVSLFSLDSTNLKRYNSTDLKGIMRAF